MSRNIEPPIPKATRMPPETAPMNRRLRKKCISSIGCGTCSSHSAKAASPMTPMAAEISTRPDSQPSIGPEMIAKTTPTMPITDSRAPSRSRGAPPRLLDSGTRKTTAVSAITATGRLTRNSEPHQKWSSSEPPISGPAAKPRELTELQMPMARGRSSSSKICMTTARVVVTSRAPPIPMPARAATSWPGDWASAAPSEATPNSDRPTTSIFLRP